MVDEKRTRPEDNFHNFLWSGSVHLVSFSVLTPSTARQEHPSCKNWCHLSQKVYLLENWWKGSPRKRQKWRQWKRQQNGWIRLHQQNWKGQVEKGRLDGNDLGTRMTSMWKHVNMITPSTVHVWGHERLTFNNQSNSTWKDCTNYTTDDESITCTTKTRSASTKSYKHTITSSISHVTQFAFTKTNQMLACKQNAANAMAVNKY